MVNTDLIVVAGRQVRITHTDDGVRCTFEGMELKAPNEMEMRAKLTFLISHGAEQRGLEVFGTSGVIN